MPIKPNRFHDFSQVHEEDNEMEDIEGFYEKEQGEIEKTSFHPVPDEVSEEKESESVDLNKMKRKN